LILNHGWFASGITIDDSRRPFLVPTRLLQEVLLTSAGSGAGTAAAGYNAVAAGFFQINGTSIGPVFNALSAASQPNGEFLLSFPGYRNPLTTPGLNYIVKGTVQDTAAVGNTRAVLEVVGFETSGIRIRILNTAGAPLGAGFGFMVEVAQIGG
ncbi:MAG: hypothetical protein JOY92_07150, partial [Verrucomicrobia bacterium]|nr:hypothetical protein [Verrucomicrobiota bacterium]